VIITRWWELGSSIVKLKQAATDPSAASTFRNTLKHSDLPNHPQQTAKIYVNISTQSHHARPCHPHPVLDASMARHALRSTPAVAAAAERHISHKRSDCHCQHNIAIISHKEQPAKISSVQVVTSWHRPQAQRQPDSHDKERIKHLSRIEHSLDHPSPSLTICA